MRSTNASNSGELDMSAIEEVCEKMQTECYNGLIVIKSTLQPGTMESLRKNCPDLRLAYVPEFLREKDAIEWFEYPDRIVYSCTDEDEDLLKIAFSWVDFDIPRLKMSDIEAEIGKLAHNAYIATKVTFTCEIERIADSMGCDAMKVMRTVWTDRRVNNSAHLTPYKGGFGGKCVPKDTAALCSIDEDTESLIHHLQSRGHEDSVNKRRH